LAARQFQRGAVGRFKVESVAGLGRREWLRGRRNHGYTCYVKRFGYIERYGSRRKNGERQSACRSIGSDDVVDIAWSRTIMP
jgi:hypothetical protein